MYRRIFVLTFMLATDVESASMLQKETSLRRHRRRRKAFMCPLVCVLDLVFGVWTKSFEL